VKDEELVYAPVIERRFEVHHWEGPEALCRCEWHDDQGRPNLSVNGRTGLYRCFVCGARGKIGGLTEDEEMAALRSKLKAMDEPDVEETQEKPESWLKQFGGHSYWKTGRGFSRRTIERFNLGYDPHTNRLTIPIRSIEGNLLGAIYRALDDSKPKYLHPKGFRTGHHLFAAHLLANRTKVALVEGPLDAVACWDARVPAVAVYGARLTEGQAHLLRLLGVDTVVPMFDNDPAGRAAADGIREYIPDLIIHKGLWRWDYAKDPGELRPEHRRMFWRSAGLVPM
jgi:DNA primase